MSFKRFYPFTVGCVLAVLMSVAPAVLGQVTTHATDAGTKYDIAFGSEWRKDEVQRCRYQSRC